MTSADMKSAVRKALGDRQYLPVQFTTSEQPTRWRRGMVYLNGHKVVFASYGATMEGVASWRVEDSEVSTERGIEMRLSNRDLYDIDVDFVERRIVTGAPEEYTWKPEDDERVREWLAETVEAESLTEARLDAASLPGFLIKSPIKLKVQYQSGESREHPGKAVDYMLAEVDGVELYAEAEPVDGDETGTYDELRVEIMRQAVEHGIDLTRLEFGYDDQPATRLLSTSQAADILSITEMRVRQLCEEGRMGRKVGRDWIVTPEEIEANRERRAGRPRKEEESGQ